MPLVNPTMKLSEVVEEHTSLIPVITRFGIRLGLGDKSAPEIISSLILEITLSVGVSKL